MILFNWKITEIQTRQSLNKMKHEEEVAKGQIQYLVFLAYAVLSTLLELRC